VFLGHIDGELDSTLVIRSEVARWIRTLKPEVVLGHDPWKRYRLHPDHQRAGELLVAGIVAARDPHFFPGAGAPHRPSRLLLFEAQDVDHVEVVDDAAVDAKVAALLCHHSQWRSTMGIEEDGPDSEAQRAAFEAHIRGEVASAGGEEFKLIVDL